ncbi:MAG: DUF1826 domain-containing protein [Tropicimonas sp.]|uniref:DUF1826 domain-containing protein n=1 Tax=Tropicimonas sp. TaxID=2067044 RepID=UPI003A8C059C
MNVLAFPRRGRANAIVQAREPSVLHSIAAPGVATTIWQRDPAPGVTRWINALAPENLPRLRSTVTVGAVETCVHAACDMAGTPPGRFRDMLASDIAALGLIMTEVMGTPLLQLRLDVVSTNACRRFHLDQMTARMLCTYRGAGTQFAQPGQEHSPVSMMAGSVALLRGARWPGGEETTLLHRSPPIEGTGETRLLAVIDPASDHATNDGMH